MRVMVMVKATASSEAGLLPSEELMMEMGRYNEELVKAGIMKSGDGLKPSSQGFRVRFSGKDRRVIGGPFAEVNELVAGYWIWEVKSVEEALDWVKKCPNPMIEESEIEIRPFYEAEDFAPCDPEGRVAALEEGLSRAMAGQKAIVQPYLFFDGNCAEALEFYKRALGARVGTVMRTSECPDPLPASMQKPGIENKVMHSDFTVGDTMIMASDSCDEAPSSGGFRLSLSVPTEADVDRIFHALADGGRVDMPPGPTFWSPRFAMVTDKFHVGWMLGVHSA